MIIEILTNGWCNIKFEKTNCRVNASYLTDVPNDLLDMCINYYNNNTASCYFDSEGSTATLVLTPDTAFIIHEGEHLGLIKLLESPKEIIDCIVKEIVKQIDSAASFLSCECDDLFQYEKRKSELIQKLYFVHDKSNSN